MPHRYSWLVTASRDPGYLIPTEWLDSAILEIRGEWVMLDSDLAATYGVTKVGLLTLGRTGL